MYVANKAGGKDVVLGLEGGSWWSDSFLSGDASNSADVPGRLKEEAWSWQKVENMPINVRAAPTYKDCLVAKSLVWAINLSSRPSTSPVFPENS